MTMVMTVPRIESLDERRHNTHLPIVSAKPTKINALSSSPRTNGGCNLDRIAKIGNDVSALGDGRQIGPLQPGLQ